MHFGQPAVEAVRFAMRFSVGTGGAVDTYDVATKEIQLGVEACRRDGWPRCTSGMASTPNEGTSLVEAILERTSTKSPGKPVRRVLLNAADMATLAWAIDRRSPEMLGSAEGYALRGVPVCEMSGVPSGGVFDTGDGFERISKELDTAKAK